MIWLALFATFAVAFIVGWVIGAQRTDRDWRTAIGAAVDEMAPHVPDPRDRDLLDVFQARIEDHL